MAFHRLTSVTTRDGATLNPLPGDTDRNMLIFTLLLTIFLLFN